MSSGSEVPLSVLDEKRRTLVNNAFHDQLIFEKYSYETKGEYTEFLINLFPSAGNPLHYHNTFIEEFFPLSGTLGLQLDKDIIHLEAGKSARVPRGVAHKFFNDSKEEVKFRCRLTPGNAGFEKSVYIAYGLANDGLTDSEGVANSFLHKCILATWGDLNLAGFVGRLLKPVMALGAWYARLAGIEADLVKRYYSL